MHVRPTKESREFDKRFKEWCSLSPRQQEEIGRQNRIAEWNRWHGNAEPRREWKPEPEFEMTKKQFLFLMLCLVIAIIMWFVAIHQCWAC